MPSVVPKGEPPTPEKRAAAIRLLKTGLGYKSVAANLGLNGYTVRYWARAIKDGHWDEDGRARQHQRLTPQERAHCVRRIRELLQQGESVREIAVALGCPLSLVRQTARRPEASDVDWSRAEQPELF